MAKYDGYTNFSFRERQITALVNTFKGTNISAKFILTSMEKLTKATFVINKYGIAKVDIISYKSLIRKDYNEYDWNLFAKQCLDIGIANTYREVLENFRDIFYDCFSNGSPTDYEIDNFKLYIYEDYILDD